MRRFIVLFMGMALAVVSAFAVPCATGTYASYQALGSGGCTVGDATFSNFGAFGFTNSVGVPTIGTGNLLVTPGGTALDPTLTFTYVVGSTPTPETVNQSGQIFSFDFVYMVTFTGATLANIQMDTTEVNTNGGGVAATKNAQQISGGTVFTSQASDGGVDHSIPTLITGANTSTSGAGPWNIQDTVSLQAQNGTATQDNFENLYTLQASTGTPETDTVLLMGSGLLCIGLVRLRRPSRKS